MKNLDKLIAEHTEQSLKFKILLQQYDEMFNILTTMLKETIRITNESASSTRNKDGVP